MAAADEWTDIGSTHGRVCTAQESPPSGGTRSLKNKRRIFTPNASSQRGLSLVTSESLARQTGLLLLQATADPQVRVKRLFRNLSSGKKAAHTTRVPSNLRPFSISCARRAEVRSPYTRKTCETLSRKTIQWKEFLRFKVARRSAPNFFCVLETHLPRSWVRGVLFSARPGNLHFLERAILACFVLDRLHETLKTRLRHLRTPPNSR